MRILDQLASQVGSRNQSPNEVAALRCLEDPSLLAEVADGLLRTEADLVADCAEVMTMVAQRRPELVVPYVDDLSSLLTHRVTRVRWEAMHAIALAAERVPDTILELLPRLREIVRTDKSVIVRDYAVQALGNAARVDASTAQQVYPLLTEALYAWDGRQAGHALAGLCSVVTNVPALAGEVAPFGQEFADHARGTVRKAAKALAKAASRGSVASTMDGRS